jgi:hypothetical protein
VTSPGLAACSKVLSQLEGLLGAYHTVVRGSECWNKERRILAGKRTAIAVSWRCISAYWVTSSDRDRMPRKDLPDGQGPSGSGDGTANHSMENLSGEGRRQRNQDRRYTRIQGSASVAESRDLWFLLSQSWKGEDNECPDSAWTDLHSDIQPHMTQTNLVPHLFPRSPAVIATTTHPHNSNLPGRRTRRRTQVENITGETGKGQAQGEGSWSG